MHEIFGKRFYSRLKAAWHRLGETFDLDEKVSVVDAVSKTTVGVEIDAAPLSYVYEGTAYQTDVGEVALRSHDGQVFLIVDDEIRGLVSSLWGIMAFGGTAFGGLGLGVAAFCPMYCVKY